MIKELKKNLYKKIADYDKILRNNVNFLNKLICFHTKKKNKQGHKLKPAIP